MYLLQNVVPVMILGAVSAGLPALEDVPNCLMQTSHGPLEYAVLGQGLPLIVMDPTGS